MKEKRGDKYSYLDKSFLFLFLIILLFPVISADVRVWSYRDATANMIVENLCACSAGTTTTCILNGVSKDNYCRYEDGNYYVRSSAYCPKSGLGGSIESSSFFTFFVNHFNNSNDCSCVYGSWLASNGYCSRLRNQSLHWENIIYRPINITNLNSQVYLTVRGWDAPNRQIGSLDIEYEIYNSSDQKIEDGVFRAREPNAGSGAWKSYPNGTYYFKARVAGETGWVDSRDTPIFGRLKVLIDENNNPPVAKIVSPKPSDVYLTGEIINFNQTSYDIDDFFNYTWDLGDGTIKKGGTRDPDLTNYNFSYSYSTGGIMTIKLEALDERGLSDDDQILLPVIDLSVQAEYVYAYIKEPGWDAQINGTSVKFDATKSYALNVTGAPENKIICLAGDCPSETTGHTQIFDDYGKRGDFSSLNFSWVFDDSVSYSGIGLNYANFTKLFGTAYQHSAKLTVYSSQGNGFAETRFNINLINVCENEGQIWWDGNGQKHETLKEDSLFCSGIDGQAATENDNCCPANFKCVDDTDPSTPGCVLDLVSQQVCLNMSFCSDYKDSVNCTRDRCRVGRDPSCGSYSHNKNKTICGDSDFININCSCFWDGSECKMRSEIIGSIFNDTIEVKHTCDTSVSHGECTDVGFMRLEKTSTITWDVDTINQILALNLPGVDTGDKAINLLNNNCNLGDLCSSGEGTAICGSNLIKLGFFNFTNMIIAIIIIVIIYVIWTNFKNKNLGRKK